ncbi:hypothetical protein RRG08_002192 [Elysia crispata]|uniref:Uncharacterized protein n=1 Tax=Elysia crispata TaxID=231223 RepID=A0AAE0ZAW1_9GAST|nr:hypothetical protein RRG08_002192 [Elysia crispata]
MQYRYYSGASRRRQISPHPQNCDAGRVIAQSPSHGGSRWGRSGHQELSSTNVCVSILAELRPSRGSRCRVRAS